MLENWIRVFNRAEFLGLEVFEVAYGYDGNVSGVFQRVRFLFLVFFFPLQLLDFF